MEKGGRRGREVREKTRSGDLNGISIFLQPDGLSLGTTSALFRGAVTTDDLPTDTFQDQDVLTHRPQSGVPLLDSEVKKIPSLLEPHW